MAMMQKRVVTEEYLDSLDIVQGDPVFKTFISRQKPDGQTTPVSVPNLVEILRLARVGLKKELADSKAVKR